MEKTERSTREEAGSHPKTDRETSRRTREGLISILGSNEANKEETENSTEEAETNGRCILASVQKHYKDHQRAMARAQYRSPSTPARTNTSFVV